MTTLAGVGSYGFQDGKAASARFRYPYGVAVDDKGNVYVATGNTIQVIGPDGVYKGDIRTKSGKVFKAVHGMKVRKGVKYVITKWYRERPWG